MTQYQNFNFDTIRALVSLYTIRYLLSYLFTFNIISSKITPGMYLVCKQEHEHEQGMSNVVCFIRYVRARSVPNGHTDVA